MGSRADLRRGLVIGRRVVAGWVGLGAVLVLSGSGLAGHEPTAYLKVAPPAPAPTPAPYAAPLLQDNSYPPFPLPSTNAVAPLAPSRPASPFGVRSSSALTSSGIPEPAYRAYRAAAAALATSDPGCGLSWTVIAGIGRVESNHGRFGGASIGTDGIVSPAILGIRLDGSRAGTARISDSDGGRFDGDPVFDRAVGPMQFLPGTWKVYGGGANPQDMNAAALATGRYLCAGDADLRTQEGRWAAVYRYNHSDSYVSLVLSLADSYASGQGRPFPVRPPGTKPDDKPPAATPPGPPPAAHEGENTGPAPTRSPTKSPTPSRSPSPTKSPKPTGTTTPTPTGSNPAQTPTPTGTGPTTSPSPTGSPTPTGTPTQTPTGTPTTTCPTPTGTETPTPTPTPTGTECPTPTPAASSDAPSAGASPEATGSPAP